MTGKKDLLMNGVCYVYTCAVLSCGSVCLFVRGYSFKREGFFCVLIDALVFSCETDLRVFCALRSSLFSSLASLGCMHSMCLTLEFKGSTVLRNNRVIVIEVVQHPV